MTFQQNYSIGFLREGQWLYAADNGGMVCIYCVDDGKVVKRFPGAISKPYSISVSHCGKYLAIGSENNCIRLYDFHSRQLLYETHEHEGWIWGLRFSLDSKLIFSASRDATVGCFEVSSGHCIARRRVHDNEINDITISPDGRLLATVSDDQTVRLLDINLHCQAILEGHNALVFRALFLPGQDLLATCDHAGGIFLWDLKHKRPIKVFYDYGRRSDLQITGINAGVSGDVIASANIDGFVMVRNIKDGRLLTRLNAKEELYSVALCEQKGLIAAGGEAGKVFLWQIGKHGSKRVLGTESSKALEVFAYNGFGRASQSHTPMEDYHSPWTGAFDLPIPCDRVRFTVTCKPAVAPGESFIINVWGHLEHHLKTVIERANHLHGADQFQVASKGPVHIKRGSNLTVRLRMDEFIIDEPEDFLVWDGEIANAVFLIQAPTEFTGESTAGRIAIYLDGLQIARLYFQLWVAPKPLTKVSSVSLREEHNMRAFASYASVDRDRVLGRIQGMQKVLPKLKVFLDVVSLRSGTNWEQQLWNEIPTNDIFYLFWSSAASESEWVKKEWRCALQTKGLEFIDPVPLDSPESVPPPPELATKHFNDWVLAYCKGN
jgi:hypothetical protein